MYEDTLMVTVRARDLRAMMDTYVLRGRTSDNASAYDPVYERLWEALDTQIEPAKEE